MSAETHEHQASTKCWNIFFLIKMWQVQGLMSSEADKNWGMTVPQTVISCYYCTPHSKLFLPVFLISIIGITICQIPDSFFSQVYLLRILCTISNLKIIPFWGSGSQGGGSRRCSETEHMSSCTLHIQPGVIKAKYRAPIQDQTNIIILKYLEQFKSASREELPFEITTGSVWFSFLENHNKLDKDNLYYTEWIFETTGNKCNGKK